VPARRRTAAAGVGYRILGTVGTPSNGHVDITSAFTGCFGAPTVGKRVFVSVNTHVDGHEGIPLVFSARVPTASQIPTKEAESGPQRSLRLGAPFLGRAVFASRGGFEVPTQKALSRSDRERALKPPRDGVSLV
jgi:hypothetical protein